MSRPLSLFSVQAILVLAIEDGSRILAKYYSNPHPPAGHHNDYPGQIAYKTAKDQKAFEKGLLGVCSRQPTPRAPSNPGYRENRQADIRHHPIRRQDRRVQNGV